MLFEDTYLEIKHKSRGFYKEKSSKFISYAYPVYSVDSVKSILKEIKQKENSANHHCYAYCLHPDKSDFRFNDDGEPAYTAGKPIFKQIKSYNLTNILIIVVRYFGGIKLGVPGLIRAYKTAALNAIEGADIVTKLIQEKYQVLFSIEQIQDVMLFIKKNNLTIVNSSFQQKCVITLLVPLAKSDIMKSYFETKKIELNYIY